MDRIKSICIEEELCQSHDGSLEQILKQMLLLNQSIPRSYELFYCKYGTTTHTIKIGKLKSCKEANLTLLPLYSPRRSVVQ